MISCRLGFISCSDTFVTFSVCQHVPFKQTCFFIITCSSSSSSCSKPRDSQNGEMQGSYTERLCMGEHQQECLQCWCGYVLFPDSRALLPPQWGHCLVFLSPQKKAEGAIVDHRAQWWLCPFCASFYVMDLGTDISLCNHMHCWDGAIAVYEYVCVCCEQHW